MDYNNLLYPLGTVVKLKGKDQKIMIYTIAVKIDGKSIDYLGKEIPRGQVQGIAFNHEDIQEVLFIGYQKEHILVEKK